MSYIRFDKMPDSIGVGRTARNVSFKADTLADWVGEVDAVEPGETEIDAGALVRVTDENAVHNAAIPPDPEPVTPPTKLDQLIEVLTSSKTVSVEDKTAIEALKAE